MENISKYIILEKLTRPSSFIAVNGYYNSIKFFKEKKYLELISNKTLSMLRNSNKRITNYNVRRLERMSEYICINP
jgi:hypothetical protein